MTLACWGPFQRDSGSYSRTPEPFCVTKASLEGPEPGILVDLVPERRLVDGRKPLRGGDQQTLRVIEALAHGVDIVRQVGGLRVDAGDAVKRQRGRGRLALQCQPRMIEGVAIKSKRDACRAQAAMRLGRGVTVFECPLEVGSSHLRRVRGEIRPPTHQVERGPVRIQGEGTRVGLDGGRIIAAPGQQEPVHLVDDRAAVTGVERPSAGRVGFVITVGSEQRLDLAKMGGEISLRQLERLGGNLGGARVVTLLREHVCLDDQVMRLDPRIVFLKPDRRIQVFKDAVDIGRAERVLLQQDRGPAR